MLIRGAAEGLLIAVLIISSLLMGVHLGQKKGYQEGWKDALRTNPVSEELELVCAGLWVGEQNKKYFEKDNQ